LGHNPDYASDVLVQTHIHSIVRTPNNYGQGRLCQDLAEDYAGT
jgi:hypothetical protein